MRLKPLALLIVLGLTGCGDQATSAVGGPEARPAPDWTAGAMAEHLASFLDVADAVVVPLQPSAADLWSMDGTLDLAKKEGRQVALVLNRVPSAGKLREQITAMIHERGLPLLDPMLGNRTAFAQAFMAGLGAVEAAPKGPAAAEARALAAALAGLKRG